MQTPPSSHTAQYLNPTLVDRCTFWLFRVKNFPSGARITSLGRSMLKYARNVFREGSETRPAISAEAINISHDRVWKIANGSLMLSPISAEIFQKMWEIDRAAERGGNADHIDHEYQKIYQKIVELAESERITLVLYGPPFIGDRLDEKFAQECDQFFSQLAEQNEHVHYWSFHDDARLCSDLTLWRDAIHLNWNGAEILSEKIADKLKNLRADKRE